MVIPLFYVSVGVSLAVAGSRVCLSLRTRRLRRQNYQGTRSYGGKERVEWGGGEWISKGRGKNKDVIVWITSAGTTLIRSVDQGKDVRCDSPDTVRKTESQVSPADKHALLSPIV